MANGETTPVVPWWKQKTTWTGIITMVTAAGGYCTDEISLAAALTTVSGCLIAIFLRQGVEKSK